MDMNQFRVESHEAQQSRRDRLRIQQSSAPIHHLDDHFPATVEELGPDPELSQVRNVRNASFLYEPNLVSPAFNNPSQPISTNLNPAFKQQEGDWVINYANVSLGSGSNVSPLFLGQLTSNNLKPNSTSLSQHYLRSSYNVLPDAQSALAHPSSETSHHRKYGELHFVSPDYHNALQEVVTSAAIGTQELEMAPLVQHSGDKLSLLPVYGNNLNRLSFDTAGNWMNRQMDSGEFGFIAKRSDEELRTMVSEPPSTQGLCLSLSSNPPSELQVTELGKQCVPNDAHDSENLKSSNLWTSMQKSAIISKACGSSLQDIVGTSTYIHPNSGPLGPFTGYATILKSSKFLKPAQQLLDEFYGVSGSKTIKTTESLERICSGKTSISTDTVKRNETEVGIKDSASAVSLSSLYSVNECNGEYGVGSSSFEANRPKYQQKKAKLMSMQDEVSRRYKHYHQQMQMVFSSFESVAGLSAATPYISIAVKTISRHFRNLKSSISDQLQHISKALGEDMSSPMTGTSILKGETVSSRMNSIIPYVQRHKSCGPNVGFLESQHIWRPQRGLPERAVAILRAWLFDHFLHPYPTDAEKQMLAAQTGLSRNQVSNWFINARVRVWKPMVEEIHALETKGSVETNQSSGKSEGKGSGEGTSGSQGDLFFDKYGINPLADKQVESSPAGEALNVERNSEKRSRVEASVPSSIDGSLLSFVPYERGGLEFGGLEAVSLTLGLQHGVESVQQQQLFHQEDQLRQQFGGQMIHDFVG